MPKIIGESLGEHREKTRERVFAAFVELMAESSYDAISLADIAARAGLGRTSLYNHFPDKESVVLAFATDETARYVARLEEALATVGGPVDKMRTYVRQHIELEKEFHFGFGPELYGMLSRKSLVQIRDHVVVIEGVLRGIITSGIDAGVFVAQDVDSAVALVHATLQGRNARVSGLATEQFILRALGAPLR